MENFSKNSILIYAKKVRDIQKNQIDPYINLIEIELRKLYPDLSQSETDIKDWVYVIISEPDSIGVNKTLDRIESFLENIVCENKWVCKYCNKTTFDTEYDYLVGTNHLTCTLESECERSDPNPSSDEISILKQKLSDISAGIDTLKEKISKLENKR